MILEKILFLMQFNKYGNISNKIFKNSIEFASVRYNPRFKKLFIKYTITTA